MRGWTVHIVDCLTRVPGRSLCCVASLEEAVETALLLALDNEDRHSFLVRSPEQLEAFVAHPPGSRVGDLLALRLEPRELTEAEARPARTLRVIAGGRAPDSPPREDPPLDLGRWSRGYPVPFGTATTRASSGGSPPRRLEVIALGEPEEP